MKQFLSNLNRVLENRVRLGVMSLLVVNDSMEFNTLKKELELTDGNLASHIAMLEKHKYIRVQKKFVDKKPQTTYSATAVGRKAFSNHLTALEEFIKNNKSGG